MMQEILKISQHPGELLRVLAGWIEDAVCRNVGFAIHRPGQAHKE